MAPLAVNVVPAPPLQIVVLLGVMVNDTAGATLTVIEAGMVTHPSAVCPVSV